MGAAISRRAAQGGGGRQRMYCTANAQLGRRLCLSWSAERCVVDQVCRLHCKSQPRVTLAKGFDFGNLRSLDLARFFLDICEWESIEHKSMHSAGWVFS